MNARQFAKDADTQDTLWTAACIGIPLTIGTAITFALERMFKRWGW